MHGAAPYLREHFEDVRARLAARDLAPEMHWGSAEKLPLPDASVHLVVTSPPYPMIEMWDAILADQVGVPVESPEFYARAHDLLGRVWAECHRVLVPGGMLCVNVGDATRTLNGSFRLYPNHVEVTRRAEALGFHTLVPILWKKPTNKPNAFLGSGFLPPNAYVTLDCEHILIFRKGPPRKLPPQDPLRYASEITKAERDVWFSQVWDVRGARQDARAAGVAPFPAEVAERLVRMFSLLGERVLDPFAGTGVTLAAARKWGRKGIGIDLNPGLRPLVEAAVDFSAPDPEALLREMMDRAGALRR